MHFLKLHGSIPVLVVVLWFGPALAQQAPFSPSANQGVQATQSASGSLSPSATAGFQAAAQAHNLGSYDIAASAWRNFIQKYPQDARVGEAYFYLGVCEYQLKRFTEAADAFSQAATRATDPARKEEALFNQGISQMAAAQAGAQVSPEVAATTFDTLIRTFPQSARVAEAWYYRGECLYLAGKKEEAANCYRQALRRNLPPALKAAATYGLGVCLEELQKPEEAIEQYEAFVQQFPQDALISDVLLRSGDLLAAQKRFEEARRRFEQAATNPDPQVASYAFSRQGDVAAAMGQLPEAVRLYREVEKRFPNSPYAYRAALAAGKTLRRLQQWSDAIEEFRKAAENPELAAEAGVLLAETLLDAGQPAEAQRQAEELLSRVKDTELQGRLFLVQAEVRAKGPETAESSLQLFREIADRWADSPTGRTASFRAAQIALAAKKADIAREFARQFLDKAGNDPRLPAAYLLLAESNLLAERLEEAATTYSEILKKFSGDRSLVETARVRLVWIDFLQKRYSEVIARGTKELNAITQPSLLAELYYLLGASHFELKQFPEALTTLEESLKVDPKANMASEVQLLLGRAYLANKQPDKAQQVLSLLVQNPAAGVLALEGQIWLAEAQLQSGQRADALKRYQSLLQLVRDETLASTVRYKFAMALVEENKLSEALTLLDECLTRTPNHSLVANMRWARARVLFDLKRFDEAMEEASRVLAGNPPAARAQEAQYLKALCLIELKQYGPAIHLLENLKKEQPASIDLTEILYQLGWAHQLAGNKEQALAAFTALAGQADKSPLGVEALFQTGEFLYNSGAYDQAARVFHNVASKAAELKQPSLADLWEKAVYRLGWCAFQKGNFIEAAEKFAFQLKYRPTGQLAADARFMLAECTLRQARAAQSGQTSLLTSLPGENVPQNAQSLYSEAYEHYKQALAEQEKLSRQEYRELSFLRGAEAAAQLARWEESRQLLETCLERYPNSTYTTAVLCQLGWVLWKLGWVEEALSCLAKATEGKEGEQAARAHFLIGEIHFARKNYVEAIREFFIVAYGYGYPDLQIASFFEAARCYEQLGRQREAISLYQQLVDKFRDSNDPKIDTARQKLKTLAGSTRTTSP
jgi:TolA-binding protein